MNICNYL